MLFSTRLPSKSIQLGLCSLLGLAVSLLVSTDNWLALAAIVSLAGLGILILTGERAVTMAWILGVPTVFVFANNILVIVPFLNAERAVLGLLLVMIVARALLNSKPNIEWIPLERAMLFFLGYVFVSLLSSMGGKSLKTILSGDFAFFMQGYLMPALAFIVARRVSWREQDLKRLLYIFVAVGVFLAGTSVLQYFLGITIFVPTYMKVIHSATRATGTFSNASEFGGVQAVYFMLTILLFFRSKDKFVKLVLLGSMVAILISIYLSKTRAPWIGLLASLLYMYIKDKKHRTSYNFAFAALIYAGLVALPFVLNMPEVQKRVGQLSPIYNRIALAATALNMIAHHPVRGVGFGIHSFAIQKPIYVMGVGPVSAHWAADVAIPHNEFLHITTMTGLIGLALFLFMFRLIFRLLRDIRSNDAASAFLKSCSLCLTSLVIGFLVNAVFVDTGKFNYLMLVIFFLVGAVYASVEDNLRSARGGNDPQLLPSGPVPVANCATMEENC